MRASHLKSVEVQVIDRVIPLLIVLVGVEQQPRLSPRERVDIVKGHSTRTTRIYAYQYIGNVVPSKIAQKQCRLIACIVTKRDPVRTPVSPAVNDQGDPCDKRAPRRPGLPRKGNCIRHSIPRHVSNLAVKYLLRSSGPNIIP
ncbi:hypothetical protein D3C72_1330930 [compost metagenome]